MEGIGENTTHIFFSNDTEKNICMFEESRDQLHAISQAVAYALEIQTISLENRRAKTLVQALAPHLGFLAQIVGNSLENSSPRPTLLFYERFATLQKGKDIVTSLLKVLYYEKPEAQGWMLFMRDKELQASFKKSDLAVLCALARTVGMLAADPGARIVVLAADAIPSMIRLGAAAVSVDNEGKDEDDVGEDPEAEGIKEELSRLCTMLAQYPETCAPLCKAEAAHFIRVWTQERWESYSAQLVQLRQTTLEVGALAEEEKRKNKEIEALKEAIAEMDGDDFETHEKLSEMNSKLTDLNNHLKRFLIDATSTRKKEAKETKLLKKLAISLGLRLRCLCLIVCDDPVWQVKVAENLPLTTISEKVNILEKSPGLDEDTLVDATGIHLQWYVLHLAGCLTKKNSKVQEMMSTTGLLQFICSHFLKLLENNDVRWVQPVEIMYWAVRKYPENAAILRQTDVLWKLLELSAKGDTSFLFDRGPRRSLLIPSEALPGEDLSLLGGRNCGKLLHGDNRDGAPMVVSLLGELVASDPSSAEFVLKNDGVLAMAQLLNSKYPTVVAAAYRCLNNLLSKGADACAVMHPSKCAPHCHLVLENLGELSFAVSVHCLEANIVDKACRHVTHGVEDSLIEQKSGEAWNMLTGPENVGPRSEASVCLGLLSLVQPQLQEAVVEKKIGAVWEVFVECIQGTLPDMTNDGNETTASATQLKAGSALCLSSLMRNNTKLQEAFGKRDNVLNNLLEFLAADVRSKQFGAQLTTQAARLLGVCTSCAIAVRERLDFANGIKVILEVLDNYQPTVHIADCIIFCLEALENAVIDCPPAQNSLVKDGGLIILANLLDLREGPGLRTIRAAAAKGLFQCLLQRRDYRDASKVVIPSLVKVVGIGDSEEKRSAVAALEEALYQHQENMELAIAAGSIPFLISLMRLGGENAQGNAALQVAKLCKLDEDHLHSLVEGGGVAPLVTILKSPALQTTCAGVQVVADLAKHSTFREEFILCGGHQVLLTLLHSEDARTLRYACEALGLIAAHHQNISAIIRKNSSVVTRLVNVSVSPEHPEAHQSAANCLACLTEDDNDIPELTDGGQTFSETLRFSLLLESEI